MFFFGNDGNEPGNDKSSGDQEAGGGGVQMTETDPGHYAKANEEDVIGSEVDNGNETASGKSGQVSSSKRSSIANFMAMLPRSSKLNLNVTGEHFVYMFIFKYLSCDIQLQSFH